MIDLDIDLPTVKVAELAATSKYVAILQCEKVGRLPICLPLVGLPSNMIGNVINQLSRDGWVVRHEFFKVGG